MISIVIPTLDASRELTETLIALVPASVEGLVREVIIIDGGSTDATLEIADEAGANIISCPQKGRGHQLAKGAEHAKGPWLLFLHADTVLDPDWQGEAGQFIHQMETNAKVGAAVFRFALNDKGMMPRTVEFMVRLRSRLLKLPYGDQGLLIKKSFYEEIGGYGQLPLMEDVDIIRRIKGPRLHFLHTKAVTSAKRYRKDGYARRIARNLTCLGLYFAGVAPEKITRIYAGEPSNADQKESRDASG